MGGYRRFHLADLVVGVGTVLFPLPRQYTPENIVKLIDDLDSLPFNVQTFQALAEAHLGLQPGNSTILFEMFHHTIRPCNLPEPSPRHQIAHFALFLVLQFLPRYSLSHASLLKSLASDVRPESVPSSLHKPHNKTTPSLLRHSLSDIDARFVSVGGFARASSERAITVNSSPTTPLRRPSAPLNEHFAFTPPLPRSSTTYFSQNAPDKVPPERVDWRSTPPQTHHLFPAFQLNFIGEHLHLLLHVIGTALDGSNYPSHKVKGTWLDALEFVLRVDSTLPTPLRQQLACFHNNQDEALLFDVVNDLHHLLADLPKRDAFCSRLTHHNFLHRVTVIHDNAFSSDHMISITNSFGSNVYVASAVGHAAISCVTNSKIYIGAVAGVLTLQNCSGIVLHAASRSVYVSNCKDCTLYLASSSPPVFCGENCHITLAPLNCYYPTHATHIATAALNPVAPNFWNHPISASATPLQFPGRMATLLEPSRFFPVNIPVLTPGSTTGPVFPLPSEYATSLQKQLENSRLLKDSFSHPNQQVVMATSFKEWLISSGNMKQIEDLMQIDSFSDSQ
eukprot:c8583_g1_i2.p1 GENE.c8583_g1_i2~~c8583_g1_i2.p1  ORF type:complete len:564 (-),score=119.87 c8583_g1_i2:14-1705(-)